MTDGPFKNAFEGDTEGVIRREIVTYRQKNGMLVKETATRDYYSDNDYNDSISTQPLVARWINLYLM